MERGLERWRPAPRLAEARVLLRRQWLELRRVLAGRLAREHATIERCSSRLERLQPRTLAVRERERLAVAEDRLRKALGRRMDQRATLALVFGRLREAAQRHVRCQRERVNHLEGHLGAVGPLRVLARGYSVTTDAAGRLIVSVGVVRPGQRIVTRVKDGSIPSIVSGGDGRDQRGQRGLQRGDQMDLFAAPQ
jgi:exodeoxyribonuclease VII large subunit